MQLMILGTKFLIFSKQEKKNLLIVKNIKIFSIKRIIQKIYKIIEESKDNSDEEEDQEKLSSEYLKFSDSDGEEVSIIDNGSNDATQPMELQTNTLVPTVSIDIKNSHFQQLQKENIELKSQVDFIEK